MQLPRQIAGVRRLAEVMVRDGRRNKTHLLEVLLWSVGDMVLAALQTHSRVVHLRVSPTDLSFLDPSTSPLCPKALISSELRSRFPQDIVTTLRLA